MAATPFLSSMSVPINAATSRERCQWAGAAGAQHNSSLYDLHDYYSPPCAPPPSPLVSLSQEPTLDDSPFWEVGASSFSHAYEDADNYTDGGTSWMESSTVEVINQLRSLKIDFDSYRAAAAPSPPSSLTTFSSSPALFSISPHTRP